MKGLSLVLILSLGLNLSAQELSKRDFRNTEWHTVETIPSPSRLDSINIYQLLKTKPRRRSFDSLRDKKYLEEGLTQNAPGSWFFHGKFFTDSPRILEGPFCQGFLIFSGTWKFNKHNQTLTLALNNGDNIELVVADTEITYSEIFKDGMSIETEILKVKLVKLASSQSKADF